MTVPNPEEPFWNWWVLHCRQHWPQLQDDGQRLAKLMVTYAEVLALKG